MKILMIVANPNPESFSFAIAEKCQDLALANHHDVKVLDLYREKHQQPFHYLIDNAKEVIPREMKYFQEKIRWADELIFVFPVWWGSMPAILKNFIDWNFSSGFAYEYENSRPRGLLTDKSVRVFATAGTPTIVYTLSGARRRLKQTLKKQIFEFCGMQLKAFNLYGGMNRKNTDTRRILDKVHM